MTLVTAIKNTSGIDKVNPSTDEAFVRFDGITGNIQDSKTKEDDAGNLSITGNVDLVGSGTDRSLSLDDKRLEVSGGRTRFNNDNTDHVVEIENDSTESGSTAVNAISNNPNESCVFLRGKETDKGTLKIAHEYDSANGSDSGSAAISIDLQGDGTNSKALFVTSTASGGTDGDLINIRNNKSSQDSTKNLFEIDKDGDVTVGYNGTNTQFTKKGNTAGDEFYIATNGATRIQRSGGGSACFEARISGDTQARLSFNSSGTIQFGNGSGARDVNLYRGAANQLKTDDSFLANAGISTNGDLGVGTTRPSEKLEVKWASGVDAGFFRGETNTDITGTYSRSPDGSKWYQWVDNLGINHSSKTKP